jgi:hypothetical protein
MLWDLIPPAHFISGACLMLLSNNNVTQQSSRPKTKLVRTHKSTTHYPAYSPREEESVTRAATPVSSSSSSASARSNESSLRSMQLDPDNLPADAVKPLWTLWLHVRWQTSCYFLYSEYYFEAWVTSTAAPGGPRAAIDTLDLRWRHGGTRGQEVRNNVDMVGKDDRMYANGFSCDNDLCAIAVATHRGIAWAASTPEGCSIA